MSDVVLLRTLTRKSIIGFGQYNDLTVQNLLDTRKQMDLLKIYYFFRNIDFMPDIKDELCITGERVIDKKIPNPERFEKKYYNYIKLCMTDIWEIQNEKWGFKMVGIRKKDKKIKKHIQIANDIGRNRTIYSKGALQKNNQW